MTRINAELLDSFSYWLLFTTTENGASVAAHDGQQGWADALRGERSQRSVIDPLDHLSDLQTLLVRLHEARWAMITEARLAGATWGEVAQAMNERTCAVRSEFTSMVAEIAKNNPSSARLDLLSKAL